MVHNIVSSDFNGKLFPVNIKAETIHSIKCYGRVIDIPDSRRPAVRAWSARRSYSRSSASTT
jgi:acyl-CoA synthetase (NDP forming)